MVRGALLAAIVLFGGCATAPRETISFAPAHPTAASPETRTPGAIYESGRDLVLFQDQTARRVGDILTVLLVESTNASKSASTSTTKVNSVDIGNPTLFGEAAAISAPRSLINSTGTYTLENTLDSDQSFSGDGDSSQSNSVSGRIAVSVYEVLPNGNLLVRGEKRIAINQGEEYVQFSGIVRPVDIAADNTVLSTQVGDAKIHYAGEGVLADANQMGWLSRFFNSRWWPF